MCILYGKFSKDSFGILYGRFYIVRIRYGKIHLGILYRIPLHNWKNILENFKKYVDK